MRDSLGSPAITLRSMLPRHVRFFLAASAILSACHPNGAQRARHLNARSDLAISFQPVSSLTLRTPCPADTTQDIEVTAQCVGPIPVDSPLTYALARLPRPRVDTSLLETTPVVVWYFEFGGVTAMVSQLDNAMDPKSRAFEWRVYGPGVVLSNRTRFPDNWGQLRSSFTGPADLSIGELGAEAQVCSLRGVWFKLEFDYDADAQDTMTAQSIPSNAIVREAAVYPGQDEKCP